MPHSEEPISNGSRPARRGVYLLTHPRSASNLFQTMMAKQRSYGEDVQSSSYHFFDAAFAPMMQMGRGSLHGPAWSDAERAALSDPYKAAFKKLSEEVVTAKENGQQVFIKEHAWLLYSPEELFAAGYKEDLNGKATLKLRHEGATKPQIHTNPTFLPDDFLLAMQPVFQIRHPVLMFPSLLRTQRKAKLDPHPTDPLFVAMLSLKGSRTLYEWYANHPTALRPKVIDADDIMNNKAAVRQLCIDIDFDPDAVQYEWEERTEEDPMRAAFLSTIYASRGIKPGLEARTCDVEAEKAKWIVEFGEQDGEDLAKAVYDALPDYEYLLERRVTGATA